MKKGFTLVELSIVLVIIGLLIGGILVGQSLIDSATLQATVKKISEFDAAVYSFQSKYNSLPGDSKAFDGNGDSLLQDSGCSAFGAVWAGCSRYYSGEIGRFWRDLSNSGLKTDSGGSYGFSNCCAQPISKGSTQNIATVKIGLDSVVVPLTYLDSTGASPPEVVVGKHFYNILSVNQQFNVPSGDGSSLTPLEAMSIDAKLDDGLPIGGTIRATGGNGGIGEMAMRPSGAPSFLACTGGGTNAYNISNSSIACGVEVMMAISR